MKNILAKGKALVLRVKPHRNEDNFDWALLKQKGTKNRYFSATAVALAEGNFYWALLSKKETIK